MTFPFRVSRDSEIGEMDDKRNNTIHDIGAIHTKLNSVCGKVEKMEAQLVDAVEAQFVKLVRDENSLSTAPLLKRLTYGQQVLTESRSRWNAQLESLPSDPNHRLRKSSKKSAQKFQSVGESLSPDVLFKGNTPGNTYIVGECGTSNLRYQKLFQLERCCVGKVLCCFTRHE